MPAMTTPTTLTPDVQAKCPHCHRWHLAELRKIGSTAYADAMLFVVCGGAEYYVGNVGTLSRHPMRPAA
jgi:hypothetical protein